MNKSSKNDFFTKELSQAYDEKNRKLAPISEGMHFLIRLVLRNLPAQARILCVGVGTGAEIFSLAKEFPHWSFVGLDPSASMLEVCSDRLKSAGLAERCQLVHGYIQDLPIAGSFDAALSILVGHFIKRDEKVTYFKNINAHLKKDGIFINTEISFDISSPQFPSMLKNWEGVQELMGATPESLATLSQQLQEVLSVLPPEENETFLMQSEFEMPIRFFQAFMISGWHAKKR